ncbi:MAG: hypothetical protein A2504_06225 [Bdellovibrionales bacterium RIFOXYD12_FULL_39_22]|nr:MAG: hypothetical protein A2385_08545 [Bdellovibrionales bacterium RIFOXYB1_FULL_39_21]OFZ45248.1 MAG: hypothetical protein A2485_05990 [Bdellovibrionales bacterium RIFOXYC12_FULL_39_17]OFZ45562.1 MAG: hypothetical protein A2404_03125 [Bdellovibrionales bacterium RIFOXYC1_FULL_39_130]OFZ74504.1 MAG: hypothetical protein A2451_08775 [Bdellovibrionales bacterium RIFOXYC2_FULL_39_8]OFZ77423.1 MAG: hypothetical protein A2560_08715 [Bdellovibrionales bacterium RIFOXYD1_FULL_39_84]OFZ91552.1 MAG:
MYLINGMWRYFYLFTVLAIVVLHFIFIDFLFSFFYPTYGLIGLSLGLLIVLFFLAFSDKIILWTTGAAAMRRELALESTLASFQAQLNIMHIDYYRSSKRQNNIFLVASFFGRPSIIIGDTIASILSPEEFRQIIFSAIARLRYDAVAKKTFVTTLLSIILWPFIITSKDPLVITIKNILVYFLIPIFFLKGKVFNDVDIEKIISRKIKIVFGSDQLYKAAIYKVSEVEIKRTNVVNFLDILTNELSLVPVHTGDHIINALQSAHTNLSGR